MKSSIKLIILRINNSLILYFRNDLRVSQLSLVDLAGARTIEQVTIPSDEPLGVKYSINRGLSALNKVVTAMSEEKDSVPMLCEKSLLTKTLKGVYILNEI